MNAGFANLATLKAHLLAVNLRSGTTYDAAIANIGLGVASAIENFCNRKFFRTVGDVEILPADKCQFLLSRYPLESISAIALKLTEADGFVAQTVNDFVRTIDLKAGIVYLPDGQDAGPYYAQLKFTYTGGYWWRVSEPADAGYSTDTLPAGATALPDDLKLAWLLQCENVWKSRDKLGIEIATGDEKKSVTNALGQLDLIPQVKDMVQQFVRYNLV